MRTDDSLLYYAIRNSALMVRGNRTQPLWSFVGQVFALGSTSSAELCRRLSIDPHQTVSEFLRTGWRDFTPTDSASGKEPNA